MVSDAIASGDVQAINYFVAQKYVDAIKSLATANNQRTLILPIEASNMLGSLAGIAEIAKETFKDHPTQPTPPTAPNRADFTQGSNQ